MQEQCIYPAHVYRGKEKVPYDCYQDAVKKNKVGDTLRHEAGAPGVGYVEYRITRIDDTGVYGVETQNTIWVPDGEYYR